MKNNYLVGRGIAALSLAALTLTLAACGKEQQAAQEGGQPQVGVVTLKTQSVALSSELPGRTAAYRIAEVRPQVSGIVQKRLFTEGGEVAAGQQLYQIDPALYQAEVDSRRAALARVQAQLKTATLLVQRYKPLVDTRAVSRQAYDDAVAARDQASADAPRSRRPNGVRPHPRPPRNRPPRSKGVPAWQSFSSTGRCSPG
ncbi:acriflavine resistance protein a [Bordetella pertussis]|uniref:Biotin-lipoyl-like domain protein n=2 Tax=Bordetella pertussis TaxID=520 RepID=A0AAI9J5K5_BORPT|nr:biotin-lipoyl-like domain protein [Bordetella pertussis CHLA-11]ETH01500.1 biotin-lipoyl-like domain protein [Bordetella pertussis 2250905]ETH06086.1 biotin-lipoyl-like domain protein [Bordetella pertussis 2356847]ETH07577.1 biotin-lipoyl-like domain protein [Bordetella pertussis 2371640]ETH12640.1 biotin-lipoyl-like domain protein [Bordetella pertussis STO1-SEAT-0006]ETH14493.1 biotin-lipoyl-like domain protein [Bordetella pertussis STO1-SEAT-0007]ETH19128.1 biotin-lipoyl-like domain prot